MAQSGVDDSLRAFDETFTDILNELTAVEGRESGVHDAMDWFKKVLLFNVPHGKKYRGLSVVETYRMLKKPSHIPAEDNQRAAILGWCVEMLQAVVLVADDIMDQSYTRRGRPCWFRNGEVGFMAVNDAFFMESAVFVLIKSHFASSPCYVKLLELLHEVIMRTITGQCLDMVASRPNEPLELSQFTSQRYDVIVKYKTAHYSFYLPVALAMHFAGISDADSHQRAQRILLEMGHFFQVQDDYLDCFGDPEVIGKIGTDIQDKKCGWLIVQALKLCTDHQRQILEKNYGVDNPESIAVVKELYRSLGLQDVYRQYEEDSAIRIKELIKSCSGHLPESIFETFFNKIFKRKK